MPLYLTLLFPETSGSTPTLKKWLMKMGAELHAGDPLFTYQVGDRESRFKSPVEGTLKVTLWREGEVLHPGREVAVFSSSESLAQALQKQGLGKILTPEEYKSALEHAEEASIRLPPEDLP